MTLARDVAKELAKQQRRRRVLFLAVIAGLIALAVTYLRCGSGWGFGGNGNGSGHGSGKGTGSGTAQKVMPSACALRLDPAGIKVDGTAMTLDQAVAACKKEGRADVIVTGDSREGDRAQLRDALDQAGVPHGSF